MEGIIIIALIIGGIWFYFSTKRSQNKEAAKVASVENLLAKFGDDPDAREAGINRAFDERNTELRYTVVFYGEKMGQYIEAPLGRNLAQMPAREREALRSVLLLKNRGLNHSDHNTWKMLIAFFYGDGNGTIYNEWKYTWPNTESLKIKEGMDWLVGNDRVEPCIAIALTELQKAIQKNPDDPTLGPLAARLLGTGNDMAPSGALQPLTDLAETANALIIGEDERDPAKLWTFKGEGSLITIAPPGSGKTQCHVIPNLLTWTGPAVVLDIKGEIHAATAAWRAENVGPVFKFSPLDADNKHSYNPLLAVSDNDDHIWEDSRFLADMLIVPGGKTKDPFWESRARDVVTAAIANTVLHKPSAERTMGAVLDILHGIGWDNFLISLQATTQVPSMARAGKSLSEMEAKMKDSVLQTGLASLSAWEGARIARATEKSDWSPADLRSAAKPTIYICIKPNEIDSYASMLRVIVAQHIRVLTSTLPERDAAPILFFLDELPRLRHMPPVEEALEIGRQYGIKLWMFCQGLGQLKTAYDNHDGMVASCALRMFMNPSTADGTAQKLSDEMGFRESVIDGTRVKRVEPNVLAGPEFADKIIVMASSGEPARLKKHLAHSDAELARRMGAPVKPSEAEPTSD
jgi:type IV secretion system protein VirD4